jgi:hypothetical protein
MNADKMEALGIRSETCADYCEKLEELQAEVDALTVAQNQKCADCTLVKELSKKNADLMSKLSIRTAEISKLKEDIQQCIQN